MKKIKLTRIFPIWVVCRFSNASGGICKTLAFFDDYDHACLFAEVISAQNEWEVYVVQRRNKTIDSVYHGINFFSDSEPFHELVRDNVSVGFLGGKNE